VSHVATAPHECEGNLVYVRNGLSPYWAVGALLLNGFDGFSGEITVEVDGEEWTVNLKYQQGGIAPRPTDDVGGDRLYEYRIGAYGEGERKANFLIQPRFENMRHYESGDPISSPFDNHDLDEGVNVSFGGSNLEPEEYRDLLPEFVQALAEEGGKYVNPDYFDGQPHEFSNITTYERYVRVTRNMGKKLVGRTGLMHRLLNLCATERGSKFEYKVDNEEIVGKNHRAIIPKADAKRLVGEHRYGKQLKHYHPRHVRDDDEKEDDPLYHPKVGVLVKKSLNGHAFAWSDRDRLRREIDETLINALAWSGIPTKPDPTTFVADDHFTVRASERPLTLYDDPTPEMEAEQESLLVTTLSDMTPSDKEVLESLAEGGEKHPEELAAETDRGISTIYRALKRLGAIVRNDNASVGFVSKKVEQEVAALVEDEMFSLTNAADRAAKLLNVDTRQAASSAWQKWLNKYAAEVVDATGGDGKKLRIDTILSELKATSKPRVADVLDEALTAWTTDGRDPRRLREMTVEWRESASGMRTGIVGANLA